MPDYTTKNLGFAMPEGSDLVRHGDDAIRTNAEATVKALNESRYHRGTASDGTDWNNVTTPGAYYTGGASSLASQSNLAEKWPSTILVAGDAGVYSQMQITYGAKENLYYRTCSPSGEWSPWKSPHFDSGKIPDGQNIDDMRGPAWSGVWSEDGGSVAGTWTGTLPPGLAKWIPGQFLIIGNADGQTNLATQMYFPYAASSIKGFFYRTIQKYKETGANAWTPWLWIGGGSAGGTNEIGSLSLGGRAARVQAFKDAYPPKITNGKGAVVFRYDHGLNNLKDYILPLHKKYDIPLYVCLNSRKWDDPTNNQVKPSEVKAWVDTGLVEIGNHTATHLNANGTTDIYDTIVNGRKELESQLGITIHGFTVPGVAPPPQGEKFDGFAGGTLSEYSDSYAGALIQSTHAICSGTFGPDYRPLDGSQWIGTRHTGIESKTPAEVDPYIQGAVDRRAAITLMSHPSVLGSSGKFSASDLEATLKTVRSLIDAGKLARLTYYESHTALLYDASKPQPGTWVDITKRLTGYKSGDAMIRRDGATVTLVMSTLVCEQQSSSSEIHKNAIPDGYKPTPMKYIHLPLPQLSSNHSSGPVVVYRNQISIIGAPGKSTSGLVTWITDD